MLRFLFLIHLFFLWSFAEAEPQYRHDCSGTFMRPEQLQVAAVPEAMHLKEMTGLRVMELIDNVTIPVLNLRVGPSFNEADKYKLSAKLAAFLTTFPIEFLKKNSDLCFVITDRMSPYGAVTMANTMLIPTNAPMDTVAHEMSHAIDYMKMGRLQSDEWKQLNVQGNCVFQIFEKPSVSSPFLRDINNCFVSQYAAQNQSEDRAEIFAAMIQDYHNLMRKVPLNSTLTKKIQAIKSFYKSIHSEMNDSFWINRNSFNSAGRFNSCGSSIENDPACQFNLTDPMNPWWYFE